MANFVQNQGTHELMGMWTAYEPKMRERMTFMSLLNNEYTDEVKNKGGFLQVPEIKFKDPLIREYNVFDGIPLQQSESKLISIVADKDYAINELIDKHEAVAVPFNLKARMVAKAADELAMFWENKAVEAFTTGASAGTVSAQAKPDETNSYSVILKDITQVFKLGVPKQDIKVVVSADVEAFLLEDTKYTNSASNMGSEILRNGGNRSINGATVAVSPSMSGANYIVFYNKSAINVNYFEIPLSIEDIKNDKHVGASRMIARMSYGFALLNKEALIINNK